jgi:hypothetical protein
MLRIEVQYLQAEIHSLNIMYVLAFVCCCSHVVVVVGGSRILKTIIVSYRSYPLQNTLKCAYVSANV